MAKNVTDARVLRSRQVLRTAAIDLLSKTDRFSISELLIKGRVTRGTFYRHYNNREDLITDVNRELIQDFTEKTEGKFRVQAVLEVISEQGIFYNAVLNEGRDPELMDSLMLALREQRNRALADIIDERERMHLVYQWEIIIAGFWACVSLWLEDSMALTYEELLDEFREIWRVTMTRSQKTGLMLFDFDA
ncbi:TetR/AcrR family transcriptional regulator [Fructobacillus ficulneus]|uniref:Transcriptional regulator n=1 Tax=Fructobacillus ficulneus TaxID=157463 RepID=A0A0K8MKT2_9LACO|nr:hypothetical protein [Fructobacillus ficulneus]GAP00480.1 transcriptional regulator [Fructobacillus ficulneus]